MKKHIALSLLITSSTFTYGMERDSCFSSNQKPKESKLISDLRASKDEFENQLQWDIAKFHLKYPFTLQLLFTDRIDMSVISFLQYCYYQKLHKDESGISFNKLSFFNSTLKKRQKALVDGYSALGAAMIAEDISIEKRHTFIQELIDYGFKPTPKDIELAELILYDGIATHQITMLHLLHTHSEIYWFVLPQEIRTQIAQYMIQLFKKEFWLLPNKSLNNF